MVQLSNLAIAAVTNQSEIMGNDIVSNNEIGLQIHENEENYFRKINFMLWKMGVIIFSVLFISCSTPSSVVKKTMSAYVQKDADKVFKYYYNLSDTDKENLRIEFENYDDDRSILNFKIQDERIFNNNEKAEVIVKCFFKSGIEVTTNTPLVKTRSGWKLVRD